MLKGDTAAQVGLAIQRLQDRLLTGILASLLGPFLRKRSTLNLLTLPFLENKIKDSLTPLLPPDPRLLSSLLLSTPRTHPQSRAPCSVLLFLPCSVFLSIWSLNPYTHYMHWGSHSTPQSFSFFSRRLHPVHNFPERATPPPQHSVLTLFLFPAGFILCNKPLNERHATTKARSTAQVGEARAATNRPSSSACLVGYGPSPLGTEVDDFVKRVCAMQVGARCVHATVAEVWQWRSGCFACCVRCARTGVSQRTLLCLKE